MKGKYDFVYLTNTPSFYKVNLCNEIGKSYSLLLVCYGYGSEAVNTVLHNKSMVNFDYYFLNRGDSNRRNILRTFIELLRLMNLIKCRIILYSGWLAPEYNLYSFFSPKKKNVVVCESSILDVSLSGMKGWVKRIIIGRMGAALPSGRLHNDLFTSLNFKGKVNITGGVGILNKGKKHNMMINNPFRYLYVGRLIDVKCVRMLVEEFNYNGKPLTIVGCGVLETELRAIAKNNISFTGFIANEELGKLYESHDIFILPSKSEPWGLVVEEAIYWGLPVIVSDRVGSSVDLVRDLCTGRIFHSGDVESLHHSIEDVEQNYMQYKRAVDSVDFMKRDENQIAAYLNLLK